MYLLFTFYYLHKKGVLRLFYINYVALCNKIGKSPSAVAEELGFMRSVVTRGVREQFQGRQHCKKLPIISG